MPAIFANLHVQKWPNELWDWSVIWKEFFYANEPKIMSLTLKPAQNLSYVYSSVKNFHGKRCTDLTTRKRMIRWYDEK